VKKNTPETIDAAKSKDTNVLDIIGLGLPYL